MTVSRRALVTAGAFAGLTAGVNAAAQSEHTPPSERPSTPQQEVTTTVTSQYVHFIRTLRFEDLPASVVHAAKRYLLDALGCAVAGWCTEKGQIAARTMSALGGDPQAHILGSGVRTSVSNAAFANGELVNALDYDALPHIPPLVVPPLFALGEKTRASGRALLLACVVAHEIGARLSSASSQMIASLASTGTTPHVFGINEESIFGAAAGLASLLTLDEAQTAYALGLAGYYCPPQASHDWETGSPKSMVKYTPAGWICQGAVTAALLAQAGFTSNPIVLDGPAGFADFYGWPAWKPELATRGLGVQWRIEVPDFKPYACCRFIHSQLDCLTALMEQHRLEPGRIRAIHSLGVPFVANPDQRNVRTQVDAQFSIPYMLAVAANRLPLDATCQDPALLVDPQIRNMMSRITWGTHPDAERSKRADPRSYVARVEVTMDDGRVLSGDTLYARGTGVIAALALSDDHLSRKFVENCTTRLPATAARAAAELIWRLDAVADLTPLAAALTQPH